MENCCSSKIIGKRKPARTYVLAIAAFVLYSEKPFFRGWRQPAGLHFPAFLAGAGPGSRKVIRPKNKAAGINRLLCDKWGG